MPPRAHLVKEHIESSKAEDFRAMIDSELRALEHRAMLLGQATGLSIDKVENMVATGVLQFAAEECIDSFDMPRETFMKIAGDMFDAVVKENEEANFTMNGEDDDDDADED